MRKHNPENIRIAAIDRAVRTYWTRIVAGVAVLVVFSTIFSLILPATAITDEMATEENGFITNAMDDAASEPEERSRTETTVGVENSADIAESDDEDTGVMSEAPVIADSNATENTVDNASKEAEETTEETSETVVEDQEAEGKIAEETEENQEGVGKIAEETEENQEGVGKIAEETEENQEAEKNPETAETDLHETESSEEEEAEEDETSGEDGASEEDEAAFGRKELLFRNDMEMPVLLAEVKGGTQGSILTGDMNGTNSWQIVKEEYQGNTEDHKTVVSDDGMVRVQKNVISTDIENEFLVYLSMDSLSKKVLTITEFSEFISDLSWYTGQAANQSVGNNGDLIGQSIKEKALGSSDDEGFLLTLRYNGQILATATLGLSVPNSAVFIRVGGGQYIQIAHVEKNARPGQEGYYPKNNDGYYVVNVDLTERAYRALLTTVTEQVTTTETIIGLDGTGDAYVTDDMGAYIVYDGMQSVNGTVSPTQTGIKWTISGKSDPITSDPVTTTETEGEGTDTVITKTTTTWWNYNVAELIYKVHLDVTKDGFASGTEYDVNNGAVLKYLGTDEQEHSVTFQKPAVNGTLYDFEFVKTDEDGEPLPDARFTLSGPVSNPDVSEGSFNKTASSGADGIVRISGLPWGTYTLKETAAPYGYSLPSQSEWTLDIGYTSWPDYIAHNEAANDDYALSEDWKVENKKNIIAVTKKVVPYGEIKLNEIDHTVYFALWDQTNHTYLKDRETGEIIYQSVAVAAGVPSPDKVIFEGVPTGQYSVWELSKAPGSTDASAEAVDAPAVIKTLSDGTEIEIKSVGTSGNADLSKPDTPEVTVTNTYAHHNGRKDAFVKKGWALNDGTAIAAPEGASVTFTLYRIANGGQPETVGSIELDGNEDSDGEYEKWGAKWVGLPTVNEDGYTYTYMVRETSCSDPDFSAYIGQYDTSPMDGNAYQTNVGGGTIWNKRQSTEIPVVKEVTGTTEDKSRQFNFTAALPEGTAFPAQSREGISVSGSTAEFSLKDGETIVLEDIPIGLELIITEILESTDAGLFTTGASGRTGGVFNSGSRSYTFNVAQEEGTVKFTNSRNKGVLRVIKNVTGDEPYGLTSREFKFTVTGPGYPDGTSAAVKVQKSGNVWAGHIDIPDLFVGEYSVSEDAASAVFAGYTWTVSPESESADEGDANVALQTVTVTAANTAADPATAVVTNSYEQNKSDLVFYKVWVDEEDSLGLRWTTGNFKRLLTLDNGVVNAAVPHSASPEVEADPSDSNKWIITYKDMPTHVNGLEAVYTLKEDPIGYYKTTGSPAFVEETITNALEKFDLSLLKVDAEDAAIKLPGARFKLLRRSEEGDTPILYSLDHEDGIYSTDGEGKISFSLPDGYYTLTETQAPSGYIFATGDYEFKIEGGVVSGEQVTPSGTDVLPEGDNNYTITIPNTPGEALPSTGGPGTKRFKILGLAMMLAAGVMLFRKKKRMI